MIHFQLCDAAHYSAFYQMAQATPFGNCLLPAQWQPSLWGVLLYDDDRLAGGWVGRLRGNVSVAKYFAKSVYFDAYPVLENEADMSLFLEAVRAQAKKDQIVQLNLTHWVRGRGLMVDEKDQCATFLLPLHTDSQTILQNIVQSQKRQIHKAERNRVEVLALQGQEALLYLDDFQRIREKTQQHAIQNNAKASMLLKSNAFFTDLFLDPKTTLFVARIEGKVAAVNLMLQGGETAYYYSGGSDYELNKQYGCSAYMMFKAICHYNDKGLDYFDLGGVPVQPTEDNPAFGVYRFKKSFGGTYQEYDSGHIILRPFRYRVLSWVLRHRQWLRFFSNKL